MYKIVLLLVAALVALVAACAPGAAPSTSTSVDSAQTPTQVNITMSEFKIEPSMTSFKVGVPYRFVVTNSGTINHDFSISPPVMQHGGMTMSPEDIHESALAVIDAKDMPPGATKTVNVTFDKPMSASEIELACHTPGHYEAGMQVPITVAQ